MTRHAARAAAMAAFLTVVPPAIGGAVLAMEAGHPPALMPPAPIPPAPNRRGIVLMTVDSLRADRLGCYSGGASLTPAMDLLARSGIRFARAYTASVSTAPSVASLMTGLEPAGHGLRSDRGGRLNAAVTTLAENLRAAGWATAAVIGTEHLESARGLARGFDRYDEDIAGLRKLVAGRSKERRASEVAERGLAALDALPGDQPFFLWLHFYDPHYDYDPPEAQKKERPDAPYDGEVASVDDAIGSLVRNIRGRVPGGRLTFVLAGTSGEGLGDHGEVGHGFYLHETTARVPLMIVPEVALAPAGGTDLAPASLLDVAPTLLAIAGVRPTTPLDGRVLEAVATAHWENEDAVGRRRRDRPGKGPRRIYMEAAAPCLTYGWSPLVAMIEGDRKVVLTPGGRVEAFDLAADPSGSRPLAKPPRWAADLAREAAGRLGSLDQPEERRQAVAAAAAATEFPWGNSPFCAEKITFPDPRDPDRVALSAILFPAWVDSEQGISGRAGKAGLQVIEKDPANLTALDLIVILGLKNRWGDMLLDPLEIMTCNYPYRSEGYHYMGHYFTQKRDMPRALEMFRIMAIADPENEEAEYDLACTLGALDRKDEAFEHLRRAIGLGAHDFDFMRRDARLVPLRGDPRFVEMIPASGG